MAEVRGASYQQGTTTRSINAGACRFYGFVINSHSSGTIKITDGASGGGRTVIDTVTLAAGPQIWTLPEPANIATELYVTVGGTCNYTIFWK